VQVSDFRRIPPFRLGDARPIGSHTSARCNECASRITEGRRGRAVGAACGWSGGRSQKAPRAGVAPRHRRQPGSALECRKITVPMLPTAWRAGRLPKWAFGRGETARTVPVRETRPWNDPRTIGDQPLQDRIHRPKCRRRQLQAQGHDIGRIRARRGLSWSRITSSCSSACLKV
jgi:hypothetical protein